MDKKNSPRIFRKMVQKTSNELLGPPNTFYVPHLNLNSRILRNAHWKTVTEKLSLESMLLGCLIKLTLYNNIYKIKNTYLKHIPMGHHSEVAYTYLCSFITYPRLLTLYPSHFDLTTSFSFTPTLSLMLTTAPNVPTSSSHQYTT